MGRGRWTALVLLLGGSMLLAVACEAEKEEDNLWTEESGTETPPPQQPDDSTTSAHVDDVTRKSLPPLDLPAPTPANDTSPPKDFFADGRPATFAYLVEKVQPSVVNIYTSQLGATQAGRQQYQPFDDFDNYG